MDAAARPAFDCHVLHLDPAQVQHHGDTVIGTLPVHLAAQVCARGAAYLHLVLAAPRARGRELSAQELLALGATLQPFHVQPLKTRPAP